MSLSIASAMTKSSSIPRAGQLIGVLVRAFELRLGLSSAMEKAATRYFAGHVITNSNRLEIHRAIATAVADDVDLVQPELREPVRAQRLGLTPSP